jgi:hypothetical protein
VVTRGVQEGDACETELHVLIALAVLIGGGEIGFVLSVGSGDYRGGFEGTAVFGVVEAAGFSVRVDRITI